MPKFFVLKNQICGDFATVAGDDAVHIKNVLRMGEGSQITLCDGEGYDYDGVIADTSKPDIIISIKSKRICGAEPKVKITLFQALPKQGKMEQIIQKCTELGVFEIVPIYSKRCVAKPSDKLARWQRVAKEAAKQCGRGIIPTVCETVTFAEAAERLKRAELAIMPYECEKTSRLKDVITHGNYEKIGILIGPEGGFEPAEAELARQGGIQTVTLGERILRTETAAAAVIPVIMFTQQEI